MASSMPRDQQLPTWSSPPNPTVSPAGTFRGMLSRTLSRGRSTEHIPRRSAKSRPKSPKPTKHLGDPTETTSPRTRSTTWSHHSSNKSPKNNKCCSRRASSAKNPPPFAEAFRHAILHAKLETPIPSGTLKKDKGAARSPAIGVDVNASPLIGGGRSSRSNSGSHNLVAKVFILSEDSCVLQYHADGPSNRTPERVLELGPQSISVASDAIPGKHWVLNVVYDGTYSSSSKDTLKPTRPSIFSRMSSEAKKTTREMLLVFNDDCNFDQWLICVRKEIEALGGLEYRPDSRNAAVLLQSKQPAVESSPVSMHFRSAPFVRPLGTPKDASEFQIPGVGAGSPKSTARSSIGTSTDLDRLRDSVIDTRSFESEMGSSYVESSQEQSVRDISMAPSEACQTEVSVPTTSPPARRNKKDITPILILPGSRRRSLSCSPSIASPKFARTPTLATDALHGMAGAFRVPHSPVSPAGSIQPDKSPFFFMNQFDFTPYTGTETDPAAPTSEDESASTSNLPTPRDSLSAEDFDRFAEDQRSAFAYSSTEDVARDMSIPPPPYTLAPQRKSSLIFQRKSTRRSPSGTCLLGLGISDQAQADSYCDGPELTDRQFETSPKSHNHNPLSISTTPADLAAMHQQAWERSSIVANGNLDTEFSTEWSIGSPDEAQANPWQLDSSGHGPIEPQAARMAGPRQPETLFSQKMNRQRSMPNLLCRSSNPAPPPNAPLPAIPNQGSNVMDEQQEWPLPMTQPALHHARSTTLDSPRVGMVSPLNSNPVSSAELRFARRLSTVNGFHALDAGASPVEISPSQEKRSISKSPPPSTWEVWKKSPKLSSAPTSWRTSSCQWTMSPTTTPAAATATAAEAAFSIDALLRKPSSAARDERRESARDNEEATTIEVNGFRFPVAI